MSHLVYKPPLRVVLKAKAAKGGGGVFAGHYSTLKQDSLASYINFFNAMFENNKSQVGAESLHTSLHCSFVPRHSCSRAQFVKAGEPGIISHMSMNFRTITNQLLQSHKRAPTP